MKFKADTKHLFGKIKIWNKPIFNLTSIEQKPQIFQETLQSRLKINLTKSFIKPPTPNTLLGHTKETIRFNFGQFSEQPSSWLDHIEFGFGEDGYYYDVIISTPTDFSKQDFQEELSKISDAIMEFEKKIESILDEFYFNKDHFLEDCSELSNCQLRIEFEKGKIKFLNPAMANLMENLVKTSEPVLKKSQNIVIPEIHLKIMSELALSDPITFNLRNKLLPPERTFLIRSFPPNWNLWEFTVRGVPIKSLIEIFDSLLEN